MCYSSRGTRSSCSWGPWGLLNVFFPGLTFWVSTEILLIIDKLQKLDSRSLQTPWEWKNRVLLEEHYIFDVAIPLEVEGEQSYGVIINWVQHLGPPVPFSAREHIWSQGKVNAENALADVVFKIFV